MAALGISDRNTGLAARQRVGVSLPAATGCARPDCISPTPDFSDHLVDGHRFVGNSAAVKQLRRMVLRLAKANATTLIHGETGTGKEIIALLLHRNSLRAKGPLVPVNCAAIPEAMIEGELFGYEKGAFSSAIRSYPGKFGLADGGTLFLDEIGELSLAAQAKILRALESREVFPLGSMRPRRCNVRILAATNRDLEAEVAAGRFRADLFYRLAVVRLNIPPLHDRREDIPAIARHLARDIAQELGSAEPVIDLSAMTELQRRDWPGNVRELRNAIEHAMVVAQDATRIAAHDLPPERDIGTNHAGISSAHDDSHLPDIAIIEAIRMCGGQKAQAARLLKVSRTTLYRRLSRLAGAAPA